MTADRLHLGLVARGEVSGVVRLDELSGGGEGLLHPAVPHRDEVAEEWFLLRDQHPRRSQCGLSHCDVLPASYDREENSSASNLLRREASTSRLVFRAVD